LIFAWSAMNPNSGSHLMQKVYTPGLIEATQAGAVIGRLLPTDSDPNETFTFAIIAADTNDFELIGDHVVVKAGSTFNAQTDPPRHITVRVTDSVGNTFDKQFTINPAPPNNAPTSINFTSSTIVENASNGTVVGTAYGFDPDFGNTLTYELTNNAGGRFGIDANTGVVTVTNGSLLDYDTSASHIISIRVTDQGGLSFLQSHTVSLSNVNEAPTNIFASGSGANLVTNGSFESGTTGWTLTGNVSAASTMSPSDGVSQLAFSSGNSPNTGVVSQSIATVAGQTYTILFDYGAGDGLGTQTMRFEAIGGSQLISQTLVTNSSNPVDHRTYAFTFVADSTSTLIRFSDISTQTNSIDILLDNVRMFVGTPSVAENSAAGTIVARLGSNDPDPNDDVTFSLVGGDTTNFEIVGNQIRVRAGANLNFEAQTSHTVTVRATDEAGLFHERVVTIAITNVNEAPTAIAVGNGVNSLVNSSFETGPTGSGTSPTGWTSTGIGGAHSSGQRFSDGAQAYAFNGWGDAPGGTLQQTFSTVVGQTYTLVFDMGGQNISSNAVNHQLLVEAISGASTVLSQTVTDTTSVFPASLGAGYRSFTFTFTATDTSTTLRFTDQSTGIINGGDMDLDNVRVWASNLSVAENSANGTFVGTAAGIDPDGILGLTYSLADNAGGRFAINSTTGAITVANSNLLNFEANNSHSVVVRATDAGGLFVDRTINVTVSDVNEAPVDITFGSAPSGLTTAGSASLVSGTTYQLTPNTAGQAGAVWGAVNLAQDITITSRMFFGANDAGADGISFAFQNQGANVLGTGAAGMGSQGLASAFGISFDTFFNNFNNEINSDSSQFFRQGAVINQGTGFDTANAHDNLEDGLWRDVVIVWNATTKTLSYSIDGVAIDSKVYDVVATDWGGNANGWFGFGAGTGGSSNQQQVEIVSVQTGSVITVAENAANGTVVTTAAAIDPDRTGTITYSLTNNAGGRFAINSTTGQITVANSSLLDFEAATNHNITIRVIDQAGLTFDEVLTIHLTDVNETPTALTLTGTTTGVGSFAIYNAALDSYYAIVSTAMTWEAAMDHAQSSLLGGVSGTLVNVNSADEQTYLAGLSANHFWIGASDKLQEGVWRWYNGDTAGNQFWSGAGAGSAVGGAYSFWFAGEPNDASGMEDYAQVYSTAVPSRTWNDNASFTLLNSLVEWTGIAFRAAQGVAGSVMENATAGTVVGTLAATDADSGETLTYSIVGANTNFEVVGNELRVRAGASLNFETAPQHTLTVRVTDSANNTRDQLVTINVVNVNEAPTVLNVARDVTVSNPSFESQTLSSGSFAHSVTGWTSSGNQGTAGQAGVQGAAAANYIGNTVSGANFGFASGISTLSQTLSETFDSAKDYQLTVAVGDRDESMPGVSQYRIRLYAGATLIGETIGTPVATGLNDVQLYVDGAAFAVAQNGALRIELGTTSPDGMSQQLGFDNVRLRVLEANTLSLAENSANGSVVGQMAAVDPDAFSTLSYSLTNNAGGRFAINSSTGQITVANSSLLDFESAGSHTIVVRTTDQGGLTFDQNVTINLTNVNEAPVAVADTATAVEAGGIANGTAGTNPTGNVLTNDTDVDAGDTRMVTGVATGTVASASTNVGTNVTGSFGSINIAADGSYTYTVDNNNAAVQALRTSGNTLQDVFTYTMRDTAGLTSTTQITVTIQGANDAPTGVTPTTLAVTENATNGTVVGSVAGVDVDVGETFAYALTNNAGGRFAINSATGQITVLDGSRLNFEQAQSHNVVVRVTDAAGAIANQTVTISVGDVNEAPLGILVDSGNVLMTDDFSVGNANNWTLTGGFQYNNFALRDSSNGLSLAIYNPLAALSWTDVSLSADIDIRDDDTQGIAVRVQDANNYIALQFWSGSNAGVSGASLFRVVNGSTTVLATVNNLSYVQSALEGQAIGVYRATLTVVGNTYRAEINGRDVFGTVTDSSFSAGTVGLVNNHSQFTSYDNIRVTSSTIAVPENTANGTFVFSAEAVDRDAGGSVTYSLTDNAGGRFAINSTTGAVTVNNGSLLDFETASSHTVVVRATDQGGLTFDKTVTISLTNVNEAPVISGLDGDVRAYVEDSAPVLIGSATGITDVDSSNFDTGTLTVSFTAGSDSAEDVLGIRNEGTGAGQIGISGSNVTYGGVVIGSFTGGSGGANLVITLNANADATSTTALVNNLTYFNTDTENPTTTTRNIRVVLTDGDGATSVNNATTMTVATANDAPVLDTTRSPVLLSVSEHAGPPVGAVGTLVSSWLTLLRQAARSTT
jgi:VCBS repeat-containing protein